MPLGKSIEIRELGLKEREDFYHIAGLTHNFYNFWHNENLYKEQEWLAYNYLCKKLDISQAGEWIKLLLEIEIKHGKGEIEGFMRNFFPKDILQEK